MDNVQAQTSERIAPILARFVADLTYEDLPTEIVSATKTLVMDQLACQLVGSTMPWVKPALDLVQLSAGAKGESTVVNFGSRVLAGDAAFANATFGQSCELDDSAYGSSGHVGTATIPVAMAMGEREHCNGREFIVATVAGYEVMYRLMAAIRPHHNNRGFHSQSIAGPFAGAATAGKLLKLNADEITHALAIAGSHACGPVEYDQSGGEVKRIHAGLGARGGVHSALLAKFGLTGPPTIIEGKRGFIHIFADQSNPSLITADLGRVFNVQNVIFKVYPTVAIIHTAIAAISRLVEEHNIQPGNVAKIRVGLTHFALMHGAGIGAPTDVLGAQFSLAYSMALAVSKRSNDLPNYINPSLWSDPEIVELIEKVEPYAHPEAVGKRDHLAEVTITLHDGRTCAAVEVHPKGTPQNPAEPQQLISKVRSLAGAVLTDSQTNDLISAVEHLDEIGDVADLAKMLAPQ